MTCLSCTDSWISMNPKMEDEGGNLLTEINTHLSHKNGCWKWECSHPISWSAHSLVLGRHQHNFWLKACTWSIKPQARFYFKHTSRQWDAGFESGKLLAMLMTMCVMPYPEHPFWSATNAHSSNAGKICAMNSFTNYLQIVCKIWHASFTENLVL